MGYAKRHLRVARVLARRRWGVTATELAERSGISTQLARRVLKDLAREPGKTTVSRAAPDKPGPKHRAVVFDD